MLRASLISAGFGLLLATAAEQPVQAADLTVWWVKGYYPAQDEGITAIVEQYQKDTGTSVELAFYTQKDMPVKLQAALDAGEPPDVSNGSDGGDSSHTKVWANEGYFHDVGEFVEPVAKSIDPALLRFAYLTNGKTGKRAYYSFPMETFSIHVHVWKSLLREAGISVDQIPREWTRFWSFFCDTVQPAVRKATGRRDIFGVGLPMSTAAEDTRNVFNEFLLAHDAWFADQEGQLLFDRPDMRQHIAEALADYAQFPKKGCNPPGAVSWTNSDNNVNFLNQKIVMTPNLTLSIPGSRMTSNPDDYADNIATIAWPMTLAGQNLPLMAGYIGVNIYERAAHPKQAEEFLRYLVQPERLAVLVEAVQARYYPALAEVAATPFWTEAKDPHRLMLRQQMTVNPRIVSWADLNPKMERVAFEAVWPKAVTRIVVENWTPEEAADEAIARTKEIVGQ